MIQTLNYKIKELEDMKKYPDAIYYIGNIDYLHKPKVSIVGSRKPISYTKNLTHEIAQKLSNAGVCIVSGAAMGVDAIAHNAAQKNTIAVVANSLDIRYPAVNKSLIQNIEKESLILSTYKAPSKAKAYTFVQRNELVVALGDILIVTQADLNSGSLRSVEFALKMGKQIYVLAHRINDSQGTNELLQKGLAKAIYNVDDFLEELGYFKKEESQDEFLEFCKSNPSYDDAVSAYASKVFEYELMGKIIVKNGFVTIC